jgi:hypothetical protein
MFYYSEVLLYNQHKKSFHSKITHCINTATQQVTFRIKQLPRCLQCPKLCFVIKLYMFRASSVPIIRSYLLYTRQFVCFMKVI